MNGAPHVVLGRPACGSEDSDQLPRVRWQERVANHLSPARQRAPESGPSPASSGLAEPSSRRPQLPREQRTGARRTRDLLAQGGQSDREAATTRASRPVWIGAPTRRAAHNRSGSARPSSSRDPGCRYLARPRASRLTLECSHRPERARAPRRESRTRRFGAGTAVSRNPPRAGTRGDDTLAEYGLFTVPAE